MKGKQGMCGSGNGNRQLEGSYSRARREIERISCRGSSEADLPDHI